MVAGIAVITLAILVVLGTVLPRLDLFPEETRPPGLHRLEINFALCPPGPALTTGTDLYRYCSGFLNEVNVRLTADGVDLSRRSVDNAGAFFALPSGPWRLAIDGPADGTVDVLACRANARDAAGTGILASTVPEVAYGTEPLTASIIAQPYLLYGWPDNRWLASPVDPSVDEMAMDPRLYATAIQCDWFLFPPGTIAERPGIVRTYTGIDAFGEPVVHVLGSGGPADATKRPATGDRTVTRFALRSMIGGMTATTSDDWIAHYLVPAGSWVVVDRTTGHQATVDIAPGQVTRVVSVTVPDEPDGMPPAATLAP